MPPQITAQPFFAPRSEALRFLPECPRLLSGRDHLGWVAIQHSAKARKGSFNILNISTRRNVRFDLDGRPGFFAEADDPALIVIGIERRLDVFDMMRGKIVRTIAEIGSKEDVIINDGLRVPGGLIFGTKHLGFSEPVAALYFFNSNNGSIHMLASGQYCSNGKYFTTENEDEPVLYDIDSTPKKLTRYRLTKDLEGVLHQQIVFGPERFPAIPDGLRPTPDGRHIVIAYYNPEPVPDGLAQMISLDSGQVTCEWVIPGSPRVTCPEFITVAGKPKVLFTTAVEGMRPSIRHIAPHAGSIFIADAHLPSSLSL